MLNKIRKFIWWKLLPLAFTIWFRDIVGCNRFGRLVRKLFNPENRPYYDYFNFYMNEEKAQWIRFNTVTNPHTNRALSTAFKKQFPETNIVEACQYDGHWLERYCEDYLKIDLDKEKHESIMYHQAIKRTAERLALTLKLLKE